MRYLEEIDRHSGIGTRFAFPSPEATESIRRAAYSAGEHPRSVRSRLVAGESHRTVGYVRQIVEIPTIDS